LVGDGRIINVLRIGKTLIQVFLTYLFSKFYVFKNLDSKQLVVFDVIF
jgi:hypothetical protein